MFVVFFFSSSALLLFGFVLVSSIALLLVLVLLLLLVLVLLLYPPLPPVRTHLRLQLRVRLHAERRRVAPVEVDDRRRAARRARDGDAVLARGATAGVRGDGGHAGVTARVVGGNIETLQ